MRADFSRGAVGPVAVNRQPFNHRILTVVEEQDFSVASDGLAVLDLDGRAVGEDGEVALAVELDAVDGRRVDHRRAWRDVQNEVRGRHVGQQVGPCGRVVSRSVKRDAPLLRVEVLPLDPLVQRGRGGVGLVALDADEGVSM